MLRHIILNMIDSGLIPGSAGILAFLSLSDLNPQVRASVLSWWREQVSAVLHWLLSSPCNNCCQNLHKDPLGSPIGTQGGPPPLRLPPMPKSGPCGTWASPQSLQVPSVQNITGVPIAPTSGQSVLAWSLLTAPQVLPHLPARGMLNFLWFEKIHPRS